MYRVQEATYGGCKANEGVRLGIVLMRQLRHRRKLLIITLEYLTMKVMRHVTRRGALRGGLVII